jgi:TolB-like protein/tRNA A-37 threonylcarbamoyl transferase component Bud32
VTPERWARAKSVLDGALGRPEAERGDFVAEACAGDPELQAEVASLLAASARAGRFMETADTLVSPVATPRREPVPGDRLGAYRILREIGRGGMGAVYLAERADEEYRKKVAVKLVRSDVDAPSVADRFRRERQILADLEHPNIARLLDGGTTADGRPYFVMEYVLGLPIDAYCEALRLGVGPRLEIFRTVCAAVAHAHGRGVLHRDLKPGNVLVTAEGAPKLLDFGIARILGPGAPAGHTATDAHPMTPAYASPEQVRGEPLTTASDVYSLGVMLYRLLTGRLPHGADSTPLLELARAIGEEEPARPSDAAGPEKGPRLAGDLDAIVLRALRKEPGRRYASVKDFSEDIRRHLAGLPVAARRGRLGYRTERFLRRNRTVLLASAAVAVVASLLSVLALGRNPADGAGAPGHPAGIRSLAVLPLVNLSRDPEQEFFVDGMTEALIADLSRIGSLRVVSRTSVMRYRGTAKGVPEIGRELGVDAVLEGSVLRSGGRVRITTQLVRAPDDRHLWARSYDRELGEILVLQGAVARDVTAEIQGALSPGDEQRLVNRAPVNPRAYLAYTRGRYLWNRRNDESLRAAIGHFGEAIREQPDYAAAYSGLADAHFYLGYAFGRADPREAMPRARKAALRALELDDTLGEAHASLAMVKLFFDWDWPGTERELGRAIELNPGYATAHHIHAAYLAFMHRNDESVAAARRALERDALSLPVNNFLGTMLSAAGRYDEAIEQFRRTLELDPTLALTASNLSGALEASGRERESVEQSLEAEALSGAPATRVEELRRAYERGGRQALRRRKVEQLVADWNGWHHGAVTIGSLYLDLGEPREAMRWLKRAYDMRSGALMWLSVTPPADMRRFREDPDFDGLIRRIGLPD